MTSVRGQCGPADSGMSLTDHALHSPVTVPASPGAGLPGNMLETAVLTAAAANWAGC